MNHVLNIAVQIFLKKIKALPSKESENVDLNDEEDEDDNDDNAEIDDDQNVGDDEIMLNSAIMEAEVDYDDIENDF